MPEPDGTPERVASRTSHEKSAAQPQNASQRDTAGDDRGTRFPGSHRDREQDLPERFGRYRIIRKLGRGGMGAVYLAEDTQLDRRVALKVPTFGPEDGPEVLDRFDREAKAAATLQHPNLCPVFDVGQIDGVHYISMAYIEGRPLSTFIRADKPVPARQAAALVRKLATTLHEAHSRGVIHRDLKPANVMVDQRREPIIMDFGLARREGTNEARLTRTGMIVGTPAYMAPEQIKSDGADAGSSCDIYALGVILYELLTGRLPFEGSALAVIGQILTADAMPPSSVRNDVPIALERVCLKAMARDSGKRYSSMAELAQALGEYLRGESARPEAEAPRSEGDGDNFNSVFRDLALSGISRPPVVTRRRTKSAGKSRAKWNSPGMWIGGALVVAIAVGTVVFVATRPPQNTDEAQLSKVAANSEAGTNRKTDADVRQAQPPEVAALSLPANDSPVESNGDKAVPQDPEPAETSGPPAAPEKAPPAPPAKKPQGPQTFIVGPGPGRIALDVAFAEARRGDTIEIHTDDPFVVDPDTLVWRDSGEGGGALTLRAGDGFQPVIALKDQARGNLLTFRSPPNRAIEPIVLEGLTLVSTPADGQRLDPAVCTNASLEVRRCVIASYKRGVYCDGSAPDLECVIRDSYFWRVPSGKQVMSIVSVLAGRLTLENNLFAGAVGPVLGGETTSTDAVSHRNTYIQCGGQLLLSRRSAIDSRQNLLVGMKYLTNLLGDDAATWSSAQVMLKYYQGRQNLYYGGQWTIYLNNAPRQAKDISLWQQLTGNGEKSVLFEDPKFVDSRFPGIAEQVLLPPRAFKLHQRSRIRNMSIGADLSKLPEPPPNLRQVFSAGYLPNDEQRRALSQTGFK